MQLSKNDRTENIPFKFFKRAFLLDISSLGSIALLLMAESTLELEGI